MCDSLFSDYAVGVAQERLVPALMHLYSEADHVIGLDVDRDAFDKFSMRNCIDLILEEMWKDEICKTSLVNAAKQAVSETQEEGVFGKYIGSLLNDLMYLLKDCFDRYVRPPSPNYLNNVKLVKGENSNNSHAQITLLSNALDWAGHLVVPWNLLIYPKLIVSLLYAQIGGHPQYRGIHGRCI